MSQKKFDSKILWIGPTITCYLCSYTVIPWTPKLTKHLLKNEQQIINQIKHYEILKKHYQQHYHVLFYLLLLESKFNNLMAMSHGTQKNCKKTFSKNKN